MGFTVVSILGLALLMVIHEGGHYLAARAFGMRVTKFSIGFGPTFFKILPNAGRWWFTTAGDKIRIRLWKHDPERHGPTVFQVAMIPFLAYVQIAGMNPLEEHDPKDKGSYANASLLGRTVTIFAGSLANYLIASVLFFVPLFFAGELVPSANPTEVNVIENNPAAAAGLRDGDRIVEVAGTPVGTWQEMAAVIVKHPKQEIPIAVQRAGEKLTLKVTPYEDGGSGRIGVRPALVRREVSTAEALKMSVTRPPMVVKNLVVGLVQFVRGKVEGKLSGPVGIVTEGAEAAKRGWPDFMELLAALSAYLGAFNLVPFPALDGGRLMFLGYEAATRRRPNARIEAHIHAIGLLMMLGLMVYVTFANDIPFLNK